MADIKISQLDTAANADGGDLFVESKEDSSSATGYNSRKISLAQIAAWLMGNANFPSLNTDEKTIVGAINEVDGDADKVKQSPVTSGTYRLLLQKSQSDDTVKTEEANKNAGLYFTADQSGQFGATLFVRAIHSATEQKNARIVLGNNIPDGTAGSSSGRIVFYGRGDKYAQLIESTTELLTANRNFYFPNASGFIALREDTALTKTNLTLNQGYTSVEDYGGCFYEVSGHVVHLHISVSGLSTSASNTIVTLPSAVRPSSNIYGVGFSHTIANAEYSRFFVSTAGMITIRSDAATSRFDTTWLI